jgi:putative DNA primase/helicase
MIPQQALMNDALSPHTPSPLPPNAHETVTGTDIVYLADLQPQPVEWLWQHRLAAGTLAMLSGQPGSGKTWVALAIAAALTRGRDPFTGETLKPATVLYASAEHAAAQVIQPRFAGLHGDPARLVILHRAVSASSNSSPDSALRDIPNAIDDALHKTHARLVIVDPWDGLGDIDLDRASQTRPLLGRLAGLAELHHCCILLVRHLAKSTGGRPVHRGRAPLECSAALRTEFLVGSSPDAPAQTALLHVKSNLGPLAPPLDFRIGEAGNFHWTGLSNLTPEDLLAPRPTGAGLPKRKFAAQWLRDYLQPGSQTQVSIEIAAERDGVCITTLRRAKFDIGIRSSKDGKSGVWSWTLPPPED